MKTLPIFHKLDDIIQLFLKNGLLLLTAETGAGKTTLFPWKLLTHPDFSQKKIILLEPRRLAARAAAERIASLLQESVGQTVGIRTRLETRVSPQTRLEVITEGVLTRLLQQDPGLKLYDTLLFDEFHTRSLQGDLGLALAWETRKHHRKDLRIAILSATLPARDISEIFPGFPLISVPGRVHPVEVFYRPPVNTHEKPWDAAARLCSEALQQIKDSAPATILCFLPGFFEMYKTQAILTGRHPALQKEIHLLHGQMPSSEQRLVLDPDKANTNRIILATNVAETSLTIPGVKVVVDIGLERRVRFLPRTGMDHWDTLPISLASAEQRKGRAGRLGPGFCFRWWHKTDFREPFALPEIAEADLAPLVLETSAWGAASPTDLTWLTVPPAAALSQATGLLKKLDLLDTHGRITSVGRYANQFPIHPRLARMIMAFKDTPDIETAAVLAALLESDDLLSRKDPDFRERVQLFEDWSQGKALPQHRGQLKKIWEECLRILRILGRHTDLPQKLTINLHAVGRLLLTAYPDRLAKRTRLDDPVTSRWLLASGRGGLLKGRLSQADYLVITDLDGGEQNAKIFSAVPIPYKELLTSPVVATKESWRIDWKGWKPKGKSEIKIGAIVLKGQQSGLPAKDILQTEVLKKIRSKGFSRLPWSTGSERFLARCRFVEKWGNQPDWPSFDEATLLSRAEQWLLPVGNWTGNNVWSEQSLLTGLKRYLKPEQQEFLNQSAPEIIRLAAGFKKTLNYQTDGFPKCSARLQEFFGCQTTPTLCNQPIVLDILSPANRTVQLTRDLESFWKKTYPGIKKEYEGKYPKHHWPDNPKNKKYIKHQKS
ncbi:ATP-dependent helicase HrpB [bacterium]|nr:ATP-dependent helicase HrpB [bacterium]